MSKHHNDQKVDGGPDDEAEYDIGSKLAFLASPVLPDEKIRSPCVPPDIDDLQDVEALGYRYDVKQIPYFEKLFYDLWFVANLSNFTIVHEVTESSKLWSYVGYISILWFNWFLVGIFDVRFVTDSIFERLARTAHLGVMVGFSVVATNFDPDAQKKGTFQALSLILMVSRLVLVVEYLAILWHIRKFQHGKIPLAIVIAFHFIAALVYHGISFRFEDGRNSRVFVAWYVIALMEAILQLGLSLSSQALSFNGTQLTERMKTLTLIILGEGVTAIAKNVIVIVKNNGWTSATIGILTAGIATIYVVFLIYTNWMDQHKRLAGVRQLLWSFLHFPLHVFLILFMEGVTQFLQWWKLLEVQLFAFDQFDHAFTNLDSNLPKDKATQAVVDSLNATVKYIWTMYAPTYAITYEEVDRVLSNVSQIPDAYWYEDFTDPAVDDVFTQDISDLFATVCNSVFANFDIEPINATLLDATGNRFVLVFQYVYATAGLSLVLMTALHVLTTRRRGWTWFGYMRAALFALMGVALALVDLLSLDDVKGWVFITTPWPLPTLCLVFFSVLVLTHVPCPPRLFFRRGRFGMRGFAKLRDSSGGGVEGGGGDYTHVQDVSAGFEIKPVRGLGLREDKGAGPTMAHAGAGNYGYGDQTQIYSSSYASDGDDPGLSPAYPAYSQEQAYHNMYGHPGEDSMMGSTGR
ncbi:Uu.00g054040.m01.CDS01 [Anthostomella pinea]|uniref:Uu.00g054040.m01.CDS01 n=1 Tax=Anthostomella pinea TaxID=933095 RepID=A0AAI8VX94_9PEZI|nr:Uu.00g054040.m01.CDS01 [Anthostomella pinea]